MIRRRWAIPSCIAALAAGILFWYWQHCPAETGSVQLIECSHQKGNSKEDFSWNLKLDAAGNGILIIDPGPKEKQRPRSLPDKITELQNVIRETKPCELPGSIGHPHVEHSTDRMRIKTTTFDKTVTMDYVDPEKMDDEVRRAYRIWEVVDSCVYDPKSHPKSYPGN